MEISEEQKKAIYCDQNKILVLAGAGSGKTFCITERINRIIQEGTDPRSILCLTFTRAGGYEMKQRYERRTSYITTPYFLTFHSFCFSLLLENKDILNKLGYTTVPDICEDIEEKHIQIEAKLKCNISISDKKLSSEHLLSHKEKRDYKIWNATYRNILRSRNKITFDILMKDITELFVSDKDCCKYYKNKFKHIFVDEFQDTDSLQWKFVQSMKNSNIYLTGDALQSLYSFRGADNKIIKELSNTNEYTVIKLSNNYRSGKNIVYFANTFSSFANPNYRIEMNSMRDNVGIVNVTYLNNRYTSYDPHNILKFLEENKDTGKAILARSNKTVSCIKEFLIDNGFTISSSDDIESKQNIDNYLRCIISNENLKEYIIANLAESEYVKYISLSKLDKPFDVFKQFKLSNGTLQFLNNVNSIRNILNDSKSNLEKYCDILDILQIRCEELIDDNSLNSVSDILNAVKTSANELSNKQTSLYVGTIHSVKGLEFPAVYIAETDSKSFQLSTEENKYIYYVGITRAQESLYVERR